MSLQNFINARSKKAEFFDGKEQISISELMTEFYDGITVTDVITGSGQNGDYVAFTTKEKPDKFSFGGTVFLNIINEYIEKLGSIEAVNNVLKTDTSKIKFVQRKGDNGRTYYDVIG